MLPFRSFSGDGEDEDSDNSDGDKCDLHHHCLHHHHHHFAHHHCHHNHRIRQYDVQSPVAGELASALRYTNFTVAALASTLSLCIDASSCFICEMRHFLQVYGRVVQQSWVGYVRNHPPVLQPV